MSWPGWWLNCVVFIERTRQMSSAMEPMCGSKSLISVPHWPCFVNLRGLPMSRASFFLMNAKRTFSSMSSGSFWPAIALSFGLGS